MTSRADALRELEPIRVEPDPRSSRAVRVAPSSADEALRVVDVVRRSGMRMAFAGSGSTALPSDPRVDVTVSSAALQEVVSYEPDDLTIVVQPGMTIDALDTLLAQHDQSAVLPEAASSRTVGGVVAAGASGYRRLRYGPTRDRVLGVTLVTGYGKVVHGGGRVVKNVTGFDLPRLVTGAYGSLGFIAEVCLKLWPAARSGRTVPIDDPTAALSRLYQPLAILETEVGAFAYLEGSPAAVEHGQSTLGAEGAPGLAWPERLGSPYRLSVRLPPRSLEHGLAQIRSLAPTGFVAQHGVGMIDVGFDRFSASALEDLRASIGALGGAVVITGWPEGSAGVPERWGWQPQGQVIQERLTDLFDPSGIIASGGA